MSNLPLYTSNNGKSHTSYGGVDTTGRGNDDDEEQQKPLLLSSVPNKGPNIMAIDSDVADTILELFLQSKNQVLRHPKTNPKRPPEKRFRRHRNYYVYQLNQFSHWWKTSRLLVRLSGGYEYCLNVENWDAMSQYLVSKRRQARRALKSMKAIGRGGPSRDFLQQVQPFTRSIRIVLAVARGYEARRDHRLIEVGLAEAFAFMGNRSTRGLARVLVDNSTKKVAFPLSAMFLEGYLDQNSRPVIVTIGFLRAILPFCFSFIGSYIGRQLTYSTYNVANQRWKPVQSITNFLPSAGVYQDTILDEELLLIGRKVAEAIGQGLEPEETRERLKDLGFNMVGSGQGGYSVYRKLSNNEQPVAIFLHVTPYGPSILNEMPYYVVLERQKLRNAGKGLIHTDLSDETILDASTPPEASIYGYTYSGAFFKNQEWAALTTRFEETLEDYKRACLKLKTAWSLRGKNPIYSPPSDLLTLKEFIRSGHLPKKARKDKKRWEEINQQVKAMAKMVKKYQNLGKAPTRVILYLEGLDCSAKSSTGGLVCTALEDCGYVVRTAQHNRPPTAEQRQKPWMDRCRFEYPEDVYEGDEEVPEYSALVWDRGPAGDFVYGKFSELSIAEKLQKYDEFRAYDAQCKEEGVLFFKLLFVADKDSIAATLGKRLAHKRIAQDLHTWLDANSFEHAREGLDEIDLHIDPTDFVAFNMYSENLRVFTEFAINTDEVGPLVGPWHVVNTAKRHPARLALLKAFERELERFATNSTHDDSNYSMLKPLSQLSSGKEDVVFSVRALIQALMLIGLVFLYLYITWDVDIAEFIYSEF